MKNVIRKGAGILLALLLVFCSTAGMADLSEEIKDKTAVYNSSAHELAMPEVDPADCQVSEDASFTRYYYTLPSGLEVAFLSSDGQAFSAAIVRFGQEEALAEFFGTSIAVSFAMMGENAQPSGIYIALMQEFFMARNNTDYVDSTVGPFQISVTRHEKGYLFMVFRNQ